MESSRRETSHVPRGHEAFFGELACESSASSRRRLPVQLAAILLLTLPLQAQTITQQIPLTAGWNAIHIEVEPDINDIDQVFSGMPIEAVWAFFDRKNAVEFIQRPDEPPWNDPSWRRYLPSNPNTFLQTLFTVNAHHAYLVKATNDATLTITGTPRIPAFRWVPDSFNLRGFPVDPALPPTFGSFFAPSSAHSDLLIYRLDAGGEWEPVAPQDQMQSGEAYWVYSDGASDFDAPLEIDVGANGRMEFFASLEELNVTFHNRSDDFLGRTLVIENQAGGPLPLSYYDLESVSGNPWVNLPSPYNLPISAETTLTRRVAVRRGDLAGNQFGTVFQITDGAGTRHLLPVSAERAEVGHPPQGLWVGTVILNAVNEANGIDPQQTTPTQDANGNGSEFRMRLMLHVATNATVSLLKQVIQLWQDGGYIPIPIANPNQPQLRSPDPDNPGHFVLLTDDLRILDFEGATLRDGEPVGRRISCAAFDFPETHREMAGSLGPGQSVSDTFTLRRYHPTNPFLHRRHPDHDNKDAKFQGVEEEALEVTRTILLRFDSAPPPGGSVSDYGYNEIHGTYQEVLRGLHQHDLIVSGTFRLNRVSLIGELNPPATFTA